MYIKCILSSSLVIKITHNGSNLHHYLLICDVCDEITINSLSTSDFVEVSQDKL